MARTAVAVTKCSNYLAGENPTGTAGDAANDHEIDTTACPVCLIAVNANVATVTANIVVNAGPRSFGSSVIKNGTIAAAVGGVQGVSAWWLDIPAEAFYDGKIYLSSADANFGDVTFYAVSGTPTPR